ncbi:MAG: OadG family protein, partial [Ruminococcus sp.]|nr:OadG family protein [Ruminococcus sp.]
MSGDKLTLSVTVLLTGFAVVFAVLFLLIGIIKAYGTIIYNIQNKGQKKKKNTPPVKVTSQPKVMEPIATVEA